MPQKGSKQIINRLLAILEIQMTTVLTQIANEMDSYPLDETTIEAVDVALQSGTQSVINVGEVWKFKIKVTNNGHLNMTGVSVHVTGANGTTVSTQPATGFTASTLTVGSLTVNGGGASSTTSYLYFTAPPQQKPAGTVLLNFHIFDWSTDFVGHFISNHTKDETNATVVYPRETYAAQVFP